METAILRDLGWILVAAALFLLATRPLRVPGIVAYLLAGLTLGPATGLVEPTSAVEVISETGIVLLLFLVGLELSFGKIRDVGRVAVVAGLGQVVFTAAGGVALSLLLGFGWIESLFLATALTFSSTVVVVKLLAEKQELNELYGQIAVGIFLVQDLVVVVALTFLAGLGGQEATELGAVAGGLATAFAGMALLLAGALLAARWLLPRILEWAASSRETLFIWSLFWCFLFIAAAELMGLSVEIGGFLAGISLAQHPTSRELRIRVHPLVNFFIAVFFVSLGTQMELGAAAEHWGAAAALSLFVLLGNPFIFMLLITGMGFGQRTAFLTSVTVAQISEFSFIFAALGLATGVIDQSVLSLVALVGLITISLSAYMILYNHELYRWIRRTRILGIFGAAEEEDHPEGVEGEAELRNHVIVVGMNALGRSLVERLADRDEAVLAVDLDARKLRGLPGHTLQGNVEYPSVLEEAGFRRAKLVVSALRIEDVNNLVAYRCSQAGVPVVVHAFTPESAEAILERGLDVELLMMSAYQGTRKAIVELRKLGILR